MIYDTTKKYRLLIVEDNPGDFVLIEEHLSAISFISEIDHAASFNELKDFAQKTQAPYDAVLLDLKLPDIEGEELIRETIKQVNPAPVIVLTGYSDMAFSLRSLSMGISDYIVKDKLEPYGLWKSIRYSIERNSMYKKLRESEKKYRELFENNPSPMLIWDPRTGNIIDSNTEAELKYGYSKEEFLELTLDDIQLKKFGRPLNGNDEKSENYSQLQAKQVWRHRKKGGEIFFAEVNGHVLEYKGKTASLMLLNDVTDKIDLQEKMIESALQAEEQERNRVARELHDGIVQQLAACGMFTQNLMDEIRNPEMLESKISRLYDLLQKTTLQTRDLSHNLQSAEFDVMTFSELLKQLVRQLSSTSDIEFSLTDHLPEELCLTPKIKVNLYRIVQELCVNIIKHSGATRADIISELAGEYLSLSIKDDGRIFNPDSEVTNGAGMINVNSRVFRLGGYLNYHQHEQTGMVVNVEIPASHEVKNL